MAACTFHSMVAQRTLESSRAYARYENASWKPGDVSADSGFFVPGSKIGAAHERARHLRLWSRDSGWAQVVWIAEVREVVLQTQYGPDPDCQVHPRT